MKSLSFTVSTKKGDIQQTRWLVSEVCEKRAELTKLEKLIDEAKF